MSRVIWVLAVLLSHWRRHPMQLATLLIGLISATALWSGVQALNQQARSSYDRAAATFGGARTAALVGRDGKPFSQQLFVELRRAGWPASPVLEGRSGCWASSPSRCPRKWAMRRRSEERTCNRSSRRRDKRWWRPKRLPN